MLAAVLVNPHLFGFDLLVLAVLILLGNWLLSEVPQANATERDQLACVLYGPYALPLLAPLTLITHVQLSVLAIVGLQWVLWREASGTEALRYLHVEQAQPRKPILLQQPLVDVLLQQLIDLRARHLAAIWRQFAIGLRTHRD